MFSSIGRVEPAHASPCGFHRHACGGAGVGMSRCEWRIPRGRTMALPLSLGRGIRPTPQMKKPPIGGLFGALLVRGLRGFGLLGGLSTALDEARTEILADFFQALGPADDFEQGVAFGGGSHHVAAEGEVGIGQA